MRKVKNDTPLLKDSIFKRKEKYGRKNAEEDRLLGCLMMESKTGEFVTFEDVLSALRKK